MGFLDPNTYGTITNYVNILSNEIDPLGATVRNLAMSLPHLSCIFFIFERPLRLRSGK